MIHRTLVVTAMFPPSTGGAERYLDTLVRGLDSERVIVVAPPHASAAAYDHSLPTRVIRRDVHAGKLRPSWLSHLSWMIRLVRTEKVTRIVFGHYAGFVGLGPILKLVTGTPYVVSVFGLDFIAYRKTLFRRAMLRWTLRRAEWITTISRHTQELLIAFGIPEGKIVLAPPAVIVPEQPTSESVAALRQELNLEHQSILLTVSRLVKRKGHARVLRALPEVLAQHPDMTYCIVGDGPYLEQLKALVRELQLDPHVRFLGRLPDETLDRLYAAADVFIMTPLSTSDDTEGFGIVYLESLVRKTPIIATQSGGVSDIVRDMENGLALNDAADPPAISQAILRLLADVQLREQLGERGQADVISRFPLAGQLAPFKTLLATPDERSDSPVVSVVIPAWNSEDSIARTLHSLKVQTFRNIEIIVVDDGSTDATQSIVAGFPDVQFIRQAHGGAPRARNRGRDIARGEFILFCDDDVILHPRMIERMVTSLKLKPKATYAYVNFRFGWRTFDLFDFKADRLRQSNFISMMSLIRKADCPAFDESLTRLQDWDLWLTLLAQGRVGTWVPDRLFSASVGKRGISQKIQAPPAAAVARIREKHHLAT